MSKQQWLEMHERLVAEAMDANPGLSWSRAYEMTADKVDAELADRQAALIDDFRDRIREDMRQILEEASHSDADPGL